MNEVNQRISQIADYYNIKSYADFAQRTGLNHQTVSNYLKGKQKPDIDKLAQIKQSFEDINADWLLTGKGNMIKSNESLITIEIRNNYIRQACIGDNDPVPERYKNWIRYWAAMKGVQINADSWSTMLDV